MIPQVAKRGTSFKGAGLYYLHDKRQDGEASRSTSDRVEWTQTLNIMSDNPDFALRLMAATAMDKDRLKEQAGISNAGRKSKGEVYAYSLAWHPDENGQITKADMMQAVDQSIKALGAQDHQSLIVAHNDADHPHVHVIINMVHPDTGKNLGISNDRKKLHKWSNDYRKMRGEEKKYCPQKAAKFEAIEAKKNGKKVKYIKGENEARQFIDELKAANQNIKPAEKADFKALQAKLFNKETTSVVIDGKIHHLNLSKFGQYQAKQQETEEKNLYRAHKERKSKISADHRAEKKRAVEAVREQMKPAYAEAYRQDRNDRYYWRERDKTLVGKLQNAIEAAKFAASVGRSENKRFVSSLYSALANTGVRAKMLNNRVNQQLRELRKEERRQVKNATLMVDGVKADRLAAARHDLKMDGVRMKDRHLTERKELRKRWSVYAAKKRDAFKALRAKGRIKEVDENLVSLQEKHTAKKQFDDKQERTEKRSKGRGRSRSRKRTRSDD